MQKIKARLLDSFNRMRGSSGGDGKQGLMMGQAGWWVGSTAFWPRRRGFGGVYHFRSLKLDWIKAVSTLHPRENRPPCG